MFWEVLLDKARRIDYKNTAFLALCCIAIICICYYFPALVFTKTTLGCIVILIGIYTLIHGADEYSDLFIFLGILILIIGIIITLSAPLSDPGMHPNTYEDMAIRDGIAYIRFSNDWGQVGACSTPIDNIHIGYTTTRLKTQVSRIGMYNGEMLLVIEPCAEDVDKFNGLRT